MCTRAAQAEYYYKINQTWFTHVEEKDILPRLRLKSGNLIYFSGMSWNFTFLKTVGVRLIFDQM